jgi:hypothetical protein
VKSDDDVRPTLIGKAAFSVTQGWNKFGDADIRIENGRRWHVLVMVNEDTKRQAFADKNVGCWNVCRIYVKFFDFIDA